MRAAICVFGVLCCAGCVRASEGLVRDKAATDFGCADYALTVVEVGPDVYRASGCGQELIYACHAPRPALSAAPDERAPAGVVCARTPE